ncbi:MAG: hypothetical protein CVT92_14045 [Bacteroidetes bacterium HGW-Bacteroidetes-1]|jgi:hypothetical protein|nr:MAG: hypothetical protein CVT92_14045 [Bacteroidetes bacterium HGW-Bacteroidetes-1]
MKTRIFISTLVVVLLSSSLLIAGHADDFRIDSKQVENEFAELTRLEQTIVDYGYLSLSEMQQNEFVSAEFSALVPMNSPASGEAALGIPGFWWGCIFGPVGLLVVYVVTDNDQSQVKSALTGCIIGTVVSVGFYLIYALTLTAATI